MEGQEAYYNTKHEQQQKLNVKRVKLLTYLTRKEKKN